MNFRLRPETLWRLSIRLNRAGHRRMARLCKGLNFLLYHALLPVEAVVGKGLTLDHHALGVVVHPQVEIGDGCRIYHHVTLAAETWIGSPYKIILGKGVTIGAHSIVVARGDTSLTIGEGAYLGAGSVLTKDIPPGEVWAGNPARKLRDTSEGRPRKIA